MGSTEDIRALTEPALTSAGLELWDVEVSRGVVRILVDRPGGIDLDCLSAASGVLSPLLDDHPDLVPADRYQLEVSSPGVERTLRTVEHFKRYIGAELSVKTNTAVDGTRRHHGTLVQVDDRRIRLRPGDGPTDAVTELEYGQIERARPLLVWGPQPAPKGSRRAPARKPPVARAVPGRRATALDAKETGT